MVLKSVWRMAVVVALSSVGLQAVKLGESKAYKKGDAMYWAYYGASGGYDTSTNPETDCKQALKYFKQAVQEKDFAAYEGLGRLYESGCGKVVKKDVLKAIEHYKKAGAMGWGAGYASLGRMYYEGSGVPKSQKKAQYYLGLCRKSAHPVKANPNTTPEGVDGCKATIFDLNVGGD